MVSIVDLSLSGPRTRCRVELEKLVAIALVRILNEVATKHEQCVVEQNASSVYRALLAII